MVYKTVDLRDELPGQPWSNINALELDRKGLVPEKKPGRFVVHYSGPDFEGVDLYDRLRHGQAFPRLQAHGAYAHRVRPGQAGAAGGFFASQSQRASGGWGIRVPGSV